MKSSREHVVKDEVSPRRSWLLFYNYPTFIMTLRLRYLDTIVLDLVSVFRYSIGGDPGKSILLVDALFWLWSHHFDWRKKTLRIKFLQYCLVCLTDSITRRCLGIHETHGCSEKAQPRWSYLEFYMSSDHLRHFVCLRRTQVVAHRLVPTCYTWHLPRGIDLPRLIFKHWNSTLPSFLQGNASSDVSKKPSDVRFSSFKFQRDHGI